MIPKTWDDITLENYYPFERTFGEEEFEGWENLTQEELDVKKLDLRIKRACLIIDMEVEDVLKLPMDELIKVDKLVNLDYPLKVQKKFKHNGKWFRVLLDPRKWEAWRYQAIMNECRHDNIDNVHRLMYLITVQVKNRFSNKIVEIDPDEIEQRITDFKQLSVALANPIGVFFWNLYNELTEVTLSYSEMEMTKMEVKTKIAADSLRNTAGL